MTWIYTKLHVCHCCVVVVVVVVCCLLFVITLLLFRQFAFTTASCWVPPFLLLSLPSFVPLSFVCFMVVVLDDIYDD
jgi:hypothetical protein